MNLTDLVGKIHLELQGKPAAKAPQPGSLKYEQYVSVANNVLQSWARLAEYEGKTLAWRTLRHKVRGVVQDDVLTLPSGYLRLADSDITVNGSPIELIQKSERFSRIGVYEEVGAEPSLVFTDDINGKVAECTVIVAPPKLDSPESEVVCDSPQWLAIKAAAQLAINTSSKINIIDDLQASAADEFMVMLSALEPRIKGRRRYMKRSMSRVPRFR